METKEEVKKRSSLGGGSKVKCSCCKRDGKNCIELVPIFSNLTKEEMLEVAAITRDKTFKKKVK